MPGVVVWNPKCSGFQVSTGIISGLGINMGSVEQMFEETKKKIVCVKKSAGKAEG